MGQKRQSTDLITNLSKRYQTFCDRLIKKNKRTQLRYLRHSPQKFLAEASPEVLTAQELINVLGGLVGSSLCFAGHFGKRHKDLIAERPSWRWFGSFRCALALQSRFH